MKLSKAFFDDIRNLIATAHATVARGVDLVQVHTSFEIGRRIVEEEMLGSGRAAYGKEVMTALATRLTGEFGRGYSETNLKLMRLFYIQNKTRIRQSVTDELPAPRPFTLSWTHYVFLLGVKNTDERSFYEIESTSQSWTVFVGFQKFLYETRTH